MSKMEEGTYAQAPELHHNLRRMNKSISINKKLWHVENRYGDVEEDMGKTEMASGGNKKK